MITYIKGDIFKADTEAIVNTVNCVGVMGKGLALQFKQRYPDNYLAYKKACWFKQVTVGSMFVYQRGYLLNPLYIINFPTKFHWRKPSKYKWIDQGLNNLKHIIEKHQIKSIAIPKLGCENGGLDWKIVKAKIEKQLQDLSEVDIKIYEPDLAAGDIYPL